MEMKSPSGIDSEMSARLGFDEGPFRPLRAFATRPIEVDRGRTFSGGVGVRAAVPRMMYRGYRQRIRVARTWEAQIAHTFHNALPMMVPRSGGTSIKPSIASGVVERNVGVDQAVPEEPNSRFSPDLPPFAAITTVVCGSEPETRHSIVLRRTKPESKSIEG